MPCETFFSRYKLLIALIIICVSAFFLLSINNDAFTGRFISQEPKIIIQSSVSLYEAAGDESGAKSYNLANQGASFADVLISAKYSGDKLKIYLPEIGGFDLPANSSGQELCIANNIPPDSVISGYRIEAEGNYSGKILSLISIKSYDSNKADICKAAGEYISEEP